jgi:hypothetical protein
LSTATRIVDVLLEAGDGIDFKAFLDRNSEPLHNHYEQIGGDFGNPWESGGQWFNPFKSELVVIKGLEGEGMRDYEIDDFEISDEELAALQAEYPVKIDPEFPEYGDENERYRDEARDNILQAKADQANRDYKMSVYRFLDEEFHPGEWENDIDQVKQNWGEQQHIWDTLPREQQWLALGDVKGWEEFDPAPEQFTRAELKAYLGGIKV